jgi:hypothetical protein
MIVPGVSLSSATYARYDIIGFQMIDHARIVEFGEIQE